MKNKNLNLKKMAEDIEDQILNVMYRIEVKLENLDLEMESDEFEILYYKYMGNHEIASDIYTNISEDMLSKLSINELYQLAEKVRELHFTYIFNE